MHANPITTPAAPYIVGLTGGIGCGKSTVAEYFARNDVSIIDADVIAHTLTAPGGAAIEPIGAAFGGPAINADGSLNRPAMRNRVFNDPQEKARLEAILHPAIRNEIERQIQTHRGNTGHRCPYLLLVAPLLFESLSYRLYVMRTVAIDCPQSMQIARVVERSLHNRSTGTMSANDVSRIIAMQIPRSIRLQLGDDVILNDKTAPHLEAAVDQLHKRYLALARTQANKNVLGQNEADL